IIERHWGGTTGELLTVYGIVNTLTQLPGIRQVQIVVEGRPVETLAGHVDLTQPLEADPSLVAAARPAAGQEAGP
ncbi:MAG TPA: GerMN domain-containing protein, partial [Limnochordales bacterium]